MLMERALDVVLLPESEQRRREEMMKATSMNAAKDNAEADAEAGADADDEDEDMMI
jgi:hypothetical protein